jgi:hypothetical protein
MLDVGRFQASDPDLRKVIPNAFQERMSGHKILKGAQMVSCIYA